MPNYSVVPLDLLVSVVAALMLAAFTAFATDILLDGLHGTADLGHTIFAWFYVAPSIAILGFVFCFSVLMNWHHAATWRAPTFAFSVGAVLVWVWARDFGGIGLGWYLPGAAAWIVSWWLLRRKLSSGSDHVIQT